MSSIAPAVMGVRAVIEHFNNPQPIKKPAPVRTPGTELVCIDISRHADTKEPCHCKDPKALILMTDCEIDENGEPTGRGFLVESARAYGINRGDEIQLDRYEQGVAKRAFKAEQEPSQED